jgi:ATP-dependent DNA helicase RecQ
MSGGARVQHERWGVGQVVRDDGDRFTVLFDDAGYRTLALDAVLERGLVVPVAGGEEPPEPAQPAQPA